MWNELLHMIMPSRNLAIYDDFLRNTNTNLVVKINFNLIVIVHIARYRTYLRDGIKREISVVTFNVLCKLLVLNWLNELLKRDLFSSGDRCAQDDVILGEWFSESFKTSLQATHNDYHTVNCYNCSINGKQIGELDSDQHQWQRCYNRNRRYIQFWLHSNWRCMENQCLC